MPGCHPPGIRVGSCGESASSFGGAASATFCGAAAITAAAGRSRSASDERGVGAMCGIGAGEVLGEAAEASPLVRHWLPTPLARLE